MSNLLELLSPVSKGEDVRKVASEERINALQELVRMLWRGENIRDGRGFSIQRGDGGVEFRRRKGRRTIKKSEPLEIVVSRPSYMPEPEVAVVEGYKRFFVSWGTVNNVVADNWDESFDVSETPDGATYFFVKATFSTSSDSLKVSSFEILTGPDWDTHETPDWEAGGGRPDYYVFSLGSVYATTPAVTPEAPNPATVWAINPNPGSVFITEHLSSISGTGTAGEVNLTKQLSHYKI